MSSSRAWCRAHTDPELRPGCADCVFVKILVRNCDDNYPCPSAADMRRVELHRNEYGNVINIATLHVPVDALHEDRGLPAAATYAYVPGEYHIRGLPAAELPDGPIVNAQPYAGNKMFLEIKGPNPPPRFKPRLTAVPWPRPAFLDEVVNLDSPEVIDLDDSPEVEITAEILVPSSPDSDGAPRRKRRQSEPGVGVPFIRLGQLRRHTVADSPPAPGDV